MDSKKPVRLSGCRRRRERKKKRKEDFVSAYARDEHP